MLLGFFFVASLWIAAGGADFVTLGVTASRLNSPENEATNFEAAMARLAPIATVIAFGFVSMVQKSRRARGTPRRDTIRRLDAPDSLRSLLGSAKAGAVSNA
jgi:hypothetical protein